MPGDDFDSELQGLIAKAKPAVESAHDAFDAELAKLTSFAPAPEPAAKTPPFPEQAPAEGRSATRGLQPRDVEQPPLGHWYDSFLPKLDKSGETDKANMYGIGSFLGGQDEISGAVTNALPQPNDPEGMHREYAAGTRAQDTKDWVLRQQEKYRKQDPAHFHAGQAMAAVGTALGEGAGIAKAAPSVAKALGPAAAKWALPGLAGATSAAASDLAHREGTLGDRASQVVDDISEHPFTNPETLGAVIPTVATAAAPYLAKAADAAKNTSRKLLTHVFMGPEARAKYELAMGQNALPELGQRVEEAGLAKTPWYRPRTAGAMRDNAYAARKAAVETMQPVEEALDASGVKIPVTPIADDLAAKAGEAERGLLPSSPRDARFLNKYANQLRTAAPEGIPAADALATKRKLYEDINYLRQNSSPTQEMAKKRVAHMLKTGVEDAVKRELPEQAAAYAAANKNYGVASEVLDPAIKLAEKNAEAFSPSELGLASAIGPGALAATGAARSVRSMLPSTGARIAGGVSNAARAGSWTARLLSQKAGTVGATAAAARAKNQTEKDRLNSLLNEENP